MVAAQTCAGKGPDVAQKQFLERPTAPKSTVVHCYTIYIFLFPDLKSFKASTASF